MGILGFGKRKEDSPAVVSAERVLAKADVDFVSQGIAARFSVEIVRNFLDSYPLTLKQGPEGLCAVVRDRLNESLRASLSSRVELSLRKSEVSLFFQISLAMAAIEDEDRAGRGYTEEVEQGLKDIISGFTGSEGAVG